MTVLEQKFEEKLGSVAERLSGKDGSESPTGTVDLKADKLKQQNKEGQEIEQLDQISQKDDFARTIDEMRKVCCLFILVYSQE